MRNGMKTNKEKGIRNYCLENTGGIVECEIKIKSTSYLRQSPRPVKILSETSR